MSALVVNLFGAPGAGKSTGAAYVFAMLKLSGVNAELVTEFAKDKVWEGANETLKNQSYVFGEQTLRLSRCVDKVDVIVTDSPILLSVVYNDNTRTQMSFEQYVNDVFNSFDNVNYYVWRTKQYNPIGRNQNAEEAYRIGDKIIETLYRHEVQYETVPGNEDGYKRIVKDVLRKLGKEQ